MRNNFKLTGLFLSLICCQTFAQTTDSLKEKIRQILSSKNVEVGVAITGKNRKDTLSIRGNQHFPLQSVFKFHIALAVLSQIDKGNFYFKQKIKIEKKDLLPDLYSPIRDENPNGATLTLSKILEYTVSQSDNVGCEVLLRLIGGPEVVEKYCKDNGIEDISIKINEEQQQADWNLQFQNWTTPKGANEILELFYLNKNNLLSKESYNFIWKVMKKTKTGQNRLKGQLPKWAIVAHKTGSSGVNKEGLTAAVNDIGIVFLPNKQYYFISVFVTKSTENAETNEKIIADISKVTWEYFTNNK